MWRDCVGAFPVRLDLGDERFRFVRRAAEVNQYMCTGLSKRKRSGSSNPTGSPGHQCSSVVLTHSYLPPLHEFSHARPSSGRARRAPHARATFPPETPAVSLAIEERASDVCRKDIVKTLYRFETPPRRSCHTDKTRHLHPVPNQTSVRAW